MVANVGWSGCCGQGRQPPKAVAAGQPLQQQPDQPSFHGGSPAQLMSRLQIAKRVANESAQSLPFGML
jgi:hypothetical protein